MVTGTFAAEYKRKLISADDAAGLVKSGDCINLGGAANLATVIDEHLVARKRELKDVTVRTYLDTSPLKICEDTECKAFTWYSGFVLASARHLAKERGVGIFVPSLLHDLPAIVRKSLHSDIAYVVTAPMDSFGYFNFGLTVAYTMSILDSAKKIVVVVRDDMPTVRGGYDESIHLSRVDHVVEDRGATTYTLPATQPSEEDKLIAANVLNAGLLEDGSTIQIGIGGLPNALLEMVKGSGIRNCGIHTEMLTEKMIDLIEAGVITNSEKSRDRHKSVFAFSLGSRRLYDTVNNNPAFASYPVDYTNHPTIISQLPKMFSLNSTTQVDLTGQIASEQVPSIMTSGKVRPLQISGAGGQLDFVMGTLLSMDKKGRSVIALYSEHKKERSRIVPLLPQGASVTVPRGMIDHVVTEWGLVKLKGLAVHERALALIAIAHPKYRDELTRDAQEMGIMARNYPLPIKGRLPKGVLVRIA